MTEEELFELLVETPVSGRSVILDQHCAGDMRQRRRLERLLAAHERSNLLDQPVAATELRAAVDEWRGTQAGFAPTEELPSREQPGVVVGPYTLEQRLGEGGMGTVWVARQKEPVKRRVALKLIKAGMDSREVMARFDHERQALAVMDHPNIARVLDAGLTTEGRPYFAMELVNGLPLTRFCDEAKLTTEQRLEVFMQICTAVQHAHQKGIIHRDLKPANILVTMIDGKPVPKVIDFGVSKALAGNAIDRTTMTHFGAVIGTLDYMAPEQAGYSGTDVDTRADIYALGVILYELLTGLKPFDPQRMRKAAIDEVIRIIREEEPSKPSTRLSSSDARPSLAAARGLDPSRLARKIRGDLDWIALKCLEKDRSRRYETANQLALEIKRYLADEPVSAGPPTARYLLKKFLKRNRRQVAVAATLLVALLAGLAASLWQMNRAIVAERAATKARDDEAAQRKRADELRVEAEKSAERAKEGSRQAREALDTVTDDVVRSLFAKSTRLTDSERQFFNRMLTLYDRLAEFDADDANALDRWAAGYWRITALQHRLGAYDDAQQAFQRMDAAFNKAVERNPDQWWHKLAKVTALRNSFNTAFLAGDQVGAERILKEADAALNAAAVDHKDDLRVREHFLLLAHDRAAILTPLGSGAREAAFASLANEAEKLLSEAPDNAGLAALTLSCLREQLNELSRQGRYEEVLANGEHQLDLLSSTRPAFVGQGQDFVLSQKANTNRECGRALASLGRLDESVAAYRRGLEFAKQRGDAGLARVGEWDIVWDQLRMLHAGLGAVYEQQGKPKEAAAAYREALAATERWFDFVHDPASVVRAKAGNQDDLARTLLNGGGSQEEAIAAALACAAFREAHLASFDVPRDCRVMIAHHRRLAATALGKLGRIDEALDQNRKAIGMQVEALRDFAADARYSLEARNQLGWMRLEQARWLLAKKETTLAIEVCDQAIATFEEQLASEADDPASGKLKVLAIAGIGHVHHNLADHYWSDGERAKAIEHYTKAIEFKAKFAEVNPDSNDALDSLVWGWHNRGQIRCEFGEFLSGAKDFEEAIKLSMKAPVADKRFRFAIVRSIHRMDIAAENRRISGKPTEALAVFRKVLEFRRQMASREPEVLDFPQHITWSHHNICVAAMDASKTEEALAAAKDLASACIAFGKSYGGEREAVVNVTDTAFKAGKRLLDAGQPAAARELYIARLNIRLDLAERFSDKPQSLDDVMYGHYDVFLSWMVEGNLAAALPAAKASIDAALLRKSKFPQLRESHAMYDRPVQSICTALAEANEFASIWEIVQEYQECAPANRPADMPLSGVILAQGGRAALALKRYVEAEKILRESLSIFEATIPNDWQAFNVRCYLGEALMSQDKSDAAAPMLSEGYQGLVARRASMPIGGANRLRVAAELLRTLAERRNSTEDVERWSRELKKLDGEAASKAGDAAKAPSQP